MGILSVLFSGDFVQIVLYLLTMAFLLLAIMPMHECAHALMAKILGDDTAERAGRLTLNPTAHLNPLGAACMLLIGFGWAEPVPVNPIRFKNQKRRQGYMALVAFAGPLSNFLMSIVCLIIYRTILCFDMTYAFYNNVSYVMSLLIFINMGLAVFNMLPISPLDGSRILNWIIPDKIMYKIEHSLNRLFSSIPPFLYLIVFFVIINVISSPLSHFENWLVNVLLSGVDGIFNALGFGMGNRIY